MKEEINLPPMQEEYKLNEQEESLLKRYKEELSYRLAQPVTVEIYKENFITHPSPLSDVIHFKIQAGNWKRIATLSEVELKSGYGEVFHFFLRRLVDDTMADLLKRGAATY